MDNPTSFSTALDAAAAKMRKKEQGLWGRIQTLSHNWLLRLETSPYLESCRALFKRTRATPHLRSDPAIDLDSLFVISLLVHLLLLFLLTRIAFAPAPLENPQPMLVRLLDLGTPAQQSGERGRKAPFAPTGKIARAQARPPGPAEATEQKSDAPTKATPPLPAPKVLAQASGRAEPSLALDPVETLVQLPRSYPASGERSSASKAPPLAGGGIEIGFSVPKGLARSDNTPASVMPESRGRGTRVGPDISSYLEKIKRRVQSQWQYPEGFKGEHRVYLSFVLDRAGTLVRVKVVESTDPGLDRSAMEAMRSSSPFPPDPEVLKEIAGEEIGIRFHIDFDVRSTR